MPIVLIAAALAALVWAVIIFPRLTPVAVAVATVTLGYVFGHSFWHARNGPLPLTIDRLMLCVLFATVASYYFRGRVDWRTPLLVDWAVVAVLTWLSISTVLNNVGADADLPTSPFFRLIFSFWIPAFLYLSVRLAPLPTRTTTFVLAALTGLGGYLALTALAEAAGAWWAVFPKFIADPELGTHFGRSRGPALNSVSLGVYLSTAFWSAWTLRSRVTRGWQLALFAVMALMAAGIFLTYTRSVWLGLACSAFVVLLAESPRRFRVPVAAGSLAAGALVAAFAWSFVIHLDREDSGSVSQHSVRQRTAFTYVSWNMFRDAPLTGVGFGRFYDKKLPYLADRSQDFELESLRPLHHHNTFLGLLTETGMLGLAGYVAMILGWTVIGLRMAFTEGQPLAVRQMGRLLLAVLAVYLPSAVFHDLSHIFQDQWLVFLLAGLTVATAEQFALIRSGAASRSCQGYFSTKSSNPMTTKPESPHVSLFGMKLDRLNLTEATERVLDWCYDDRADECRYVVTPNVDHAVLLTHHQGLRSAYLHASMVVADGAPIVAAARLLRTPLPERVAGSDLVPSLLNTANKQGKPIRVFLLGAGPGVADRAAANIRQSCPNLEVVGTHCPPIGFERQDDTNRAALDAVAAAQPDLLIVGLGAPKQELWVEQHRSELSAKVAVCAGATIDFLAGEKQRSPRWMQRMGLEWLHRLATEPRRLAGRYFRDALIFPRLVWREWRHTYLRGDYLTP